MHEELLTPYTLRWPEGVFPLGSDTLALGEFATLRRGWRVCDLGTGSAALLLLLRRREAGISLTGVELDPLAAHTARQNLLENHLEGEILQGDLRSCPLPAGQFDLVISNPPYFSPNSGICGGSARSEVHCTLEELCRCAGRLLRSGGRFALCHRPERLAELLCILQANGMAPKRLALVCHSPAHAPSLVLVESVRGGKPGLEVLPCVFTHTHS